MTDYISLVLQELQPHIIKLVMNSVSSLLAQHAKCQRCDASAPQVAKIQGATTVVGYTAVRLGGGYSAVLCCSCINTWNKLMFGKLALESGVWATLRAAEAERMMYELAATGRTDCHVRHWIILDKAVHSAQLDLYQYAEDWVCG